jgi:hypothetical protein
MSSRKDITDILTKSAAEWMALKKRVGVYKEVGIKRWGRKRVDLLGISYTGLIFACEIKSCPEDYSADKKWQTYLDAGLINRLWFCITYKHFKSRAGRKLIEETKNRGVGILVLSPKTGYAYVAQKAYNQKNLDEEERRKLICKMAWLGADVSKRNTIRRTRRFEK